MSEGRIEERAKAKRRSSLARRWSAIGALVLTGTFSWVAAETTHATSRQATSTVSSTVTSAPTVTTAPDTTTSLQSTSSVPSAGAGNAVATSGAS